MSAIARMLRVSAITTSLCIAAIYAHAEEAGGCQLSKVASLRYADLRMSPPTKSHYQTSSRSSASSHLQRVPIHSCVLRTLKDSAQKRTGPFPARRINLSSYQAKLSAVALPTVNITYGARLSRGRTHFDAQFSVPA